MSNVISAAHTGLPIAKENPTRRAVLGGIGVAALPSAAVLSFIPAAGAVAMPHPADPAILAVQRWREAKEEWDAAFNASCSADDAARAEMGSFDTRFEISFEGRSKEVHSKKTIEAFFNDAKDRRHGGFQHVPVGQLAAFFEAQRAVSFPDIEEARLIALAEFERRCRKFARAERRHKCASLRRKDDKLGSVVCTRLSEAFATVPTTLAGLAALIEIMADDAAASKDFYGPGLETFRRAARDLLAAGAANA